MNTTDDGQPVGEDVPVGFQILLGTEHLGESPVGKILAGADLIAAQVLALKDVQDLHEHMYDGPAPDAWEYCGHCKVTWPCETMRIVERVAL